VTAITAGLPRRNRCQFIWLRRIRVRANSD